jgi:ferredoxin--NADP+ reductase
VIGTNKPDAAETAETMFADLERGALLSPQEPAAAAAEAQIRRAQPSVVTYPDWQRLDRYETERGKALGRPRLKCTTVREMLEVITLTSP